MTCLVTMLAERFQGFFKKQQIILIFCLISQLIIYQMLYFKNFKL